MTAYSANGFAEGASREMKPRGRRGDWRRKPAVPLAVDRKSGIGFADQLVAALKPEISSGKFRPGEVLPCMDAIAGLAKVSEKMARRALAQLAAEVRAVTRILCTTNDRPYAVVAPGGGRMDVTCGTGGAMGSSR